MKESIILVLLVIGFAAGIVWLVLAIIPDVPDDIFVDGVAVKHGEMLYTKLNGDQVQVVSIYLACNAADCRVLTGRRTRDGLFSMDSEQSNYTMVFFRTFELTRKEPTQ